MSMLDLLFNKGFNGAKCKTLLKLTIPRIKLLKNKQENQLKHMRKEIVQLLQTGQEATARIRVEHIIREQNIMAAYEMIELFCELVVVRLPIIESQRECPLDLKESVASLIFAAPRCSDLPELLQVRNLFLAKYGKEFIAAATELRPDCGVNRQIIEKLSVRPPDAEVKLKLMKEIANEHELDWDSSHTEAEFFKLHGDLLDGPNHFIGGTALPLPAEEEDESHFTPIKLPNKDAISQAASILVDEPVVPNRAVTSRSEAGVATETGLQCTSSAPPSVTEAEPESTFSRLPHQTILQMEPIGVDVPVVNIGSPVSSPSLALCSSDDMSGQKQFVPFLSLPPPLTNMEENEVNPGVSSRKNGGGSMHLEDVVASAQAAAESAEQAAAAAHAAANLAITRISELSAKFASGLEDERNQNFPSSTYSQRVYSPPNGIESDQLSSSGRQSNDLFGLDLGSRKWRGDDELDLDVQKLESKTKKPLEVGCVPPLGDPDNKIICVTETLDTPPYDFLSEVRSVPCQLAQEHQTSKQLQPLASMDDIYFSCPSVPHSQNSISGFHQSEFQTLDNSASVFRHAHETQRDDDDLIARLNALKMGYRI